MISYYSIQLVKDINMYEYNYLIAKLNDRIAVKTRTRRWNQLRLSKHTNQSLVLHHAVVTALTNINRHQCNLCQSFTVIYTDRVNIFHFEQYVLTTSV